MALLGDFRLAKARGVTGDTRAQHKTQQRKVDTFAAELKHGYQENATAAQRFEDTIRELFDLRGSISQEVYHVNAPPTKTT